MHDIFEDIAHMQTNIEPLNINGLKGRVLRISAKKPAKSSEILLIYGHHSSLERMYGIAEAFSEYGTVTMPDLPGFGGMDSFYKIGMKPTLDNLADYLATFVKLKYRRKQVKIVGMSLGFAIATRMLQRYPDLVKKVDVLVSMVGMTHKSDFKLSRTRQFLFRSAGRILSHRLPAFLFYNIILHPAVIRTFYSRTHNAKHKFKDLDAKSHKQITEFEVILWRINDVRTYGLTGNIMLTLDNCQKQINLPVHHISVNDDQYFDNAVIEQHMRVIFTDFIDYRISLPAHAPSIIASAEDAKPFAPKKLGQVLSL